MQSVNFKISDINSGWFDVEFSTYVKRVAISACDKYVNDTPKHLISVLNQLLSGNASSGYVSFDERPGTYVVCFEKKSDWLLRIYYTEKESCEWKIPSYGTLSISKLMRAVPAKEMLLFAEFDLSYFAQSVYRSFDQYTNSRHLKVYETQWNSFPVKEFNLLDSFFNDYSNSLGTIASAY